MTARLMAWMLALAILVLAGCSSSSPPPTASAAPPAATQATPAADDFERVLRQGTVRIGVKADTPPFGRKLAGEYVGFDIDLAEALAHQLGIAHLSFVPVTSANRITKLLDGEVDMVIASMTITRYRETKVDFVEPAYFQDGQALLVRNGSPIHSYLDLAGKTVGCAHGSDSGYYMKQVAPDAKIVKFEDFPAMMHALDSGTVDCVTSDMLILEGLMRTSGHPDAYHIAGTRFTTEPYGIAVRQNQSHWRNALANALQTLWENGRYQAIVASWFGPGSDYQSPITYAITPNPH